MFEPNDRRIRELWRDIGVARKFKRDAQEIETMERFVGNFGEGIELVNPLITGLVDRIAENEEKLRQLTADSAPKAPTGSTPGKKLRLQPV